MDFDVKWAVEWVPACQMVLRRHFPKTKIFGDINKVTVGDLSPVDIITYGFPCFVNGTLVLCKDGLKPIEDVKIGDEVWTHNNRWRKVTSTMNRTAPIITLKGAGHSNLGTTHEHPFYASEGRGFKDYPKKERRKGHWGEIFFHNPDWVSAKDLKNKYWCSPILIGNEGVPEIPKKRGKKGPTSKPPLITEDLLWLLGCWVGAGWFKKRQDRGASSINGIIICCSKEDSNELKRRIDSCGLNATRDASEKSIDKYHISNRSLAEWVKDNFGEYCGGKSLPRWLLFTNETYKRAFLDGYIFADGSHRSSGEIPITSISKILSIGVRLLATSIGYPVGLYYSKRKKKTIIEGRIVNQSDTWQLVIRENRKQTSSFVIDQHRFGKVRRVTDNGETAEVHNISVEEDESYTADGMVVHNCTDVSHAGKRTGLVDEKGETTRSGLFFRATEFIRGLRPRFAIFENVPGLLSSNKGADFARVLQTLADIGYGETVWVTLDSQHFGVAQRRKRVFGISSSDAEPGLAAECARQIYALQKSMSGHPEASGEAGQETPGGSGGGAQRGGRSVGFSCKNYGNDSIEELSPTLRAMNHDKSHMNGGGQAAVISFDDRPCSTSCETTNMLSSDEHPPHVLVFDTTQITSPLNYSNPKENDPCHPLAATAHPPSVATWWNGDDIAPTLDVSQISKQQTMPDKNRFPAVLEPQSARESGQGYWIKDDKAGPLRVRGDDHTSSAVIYPISDQATRFAGKRGEHQDGKGNGFGIGSPTDPMFTLTQGDKHAVANASRVRRLTPIECERLQGFQWQNSDGSWSDSWTDWGVNEKGEKKVMSDTVRYRMMGNAVTTNVAEFLAGVLKKALEVAAATCKIDETYKNL